MDVRVRLGSIEFIYRTVRVDNGVVTHTFWPNTTSTFNTSFIDISVLLILDKIIHWKMEYLYSLRCNAIKTRE